MSTSMRHAERNAFDHVASVCARDVDRLCRDSSQQIPFLFPSMPVQHPPVGSIIPAGKRSMEEVPQTPRDASSPENGDILILPPALPLLNDIGSVLDEMLNAVMEIPQPVVLVQEENQEAVAQENGIMLVAVESSEDNVETEPETEDVTSQSNNKGIMLVSVESSEDNEHVGEFVQHMLSQLIPHVSMDETETLAKRVAEHGHVMLERIPESEETQTRVARRLSEVTPEEVIQWRQDLFFPFGVHNNCLYESYRMGDLTHDCAHAVNNLGFVRAQQHADEVNNAKIALQVSTQYCLMSVFCLAALVVMCWRRKKMFDDSKRLVDGIFAAVYSNKDIKAAVEKEIGRPIGKSVPSSVWMNGEACEKHRKQWSKELVIMFVVVVLTGNVFLALGFISLSFIRSFFLFAAVFLFLKAVFEPLPDGFGVEGGCCDSCCCCNGTCCAAETSGCCGGCCCCCNGSSPDKVEGCCDNCCCCNGSSPDKVKVKELKGCCDNCYCCSGSSPDKMNLEGCCDSCCCCCNGTCSAAETGECCGNCCCCNGRSPDKVKHARVEVYGGFPIQVV